MLHPIHSILGESGVFIHVLLLYSSPVFLSFRRNTLFIVLWLIKLFYTYSNFMRFFLPLTAERSPICPICSLFSPTVSRSSWWRLLSFLSEGVRTS